MSFVLDLFQANYQMKRDDFLAKRLAIREWAAEDRPREKLLQRGRQALSDAELIAILLGSGNSSESAVQVAQKVLQLAENNLNELARLSVQDMMKVRGIGEAKAIAIVAALELGRRRKDSEYLIKPMIKSSQQAYEFLQADLLDLAHEEFWIILLNRANQVIKKQRISEGGVSGTVADAKMIFKIALEQLASGIILAHNHPSGNLKPSPADQSLTQQLKNAGAILGIPVLDHLIFTNQGYFSFADEGLL